MKLQDALSLAEQCGFEHFSALNIQKLALLPEVRDMCTADLCWNYGKNWCCPPACGSLEDLREKMQRFDCGILVQSTGQMEDSFDIETMQETERIQKERFSDLRDRFGEVCFPMAAGTCTICRKCAYPEPCRFPERAVPSLEACGIYVSQLCTDSGLGYYYGKDTITFTSGILFNEEESK